MKKKQEKQRKDNLENNEDFVVEDEIIEEVGQDNKLKKLRKELKEAKQKQEEYLLGWQKARAEYANYKTQEEKTSANKRARMKAEIVEDFLPVLDSFDMAMSNKDVWNSVDENWRKGIESIRSQLLSTLERHGLSEISEVNVDFDPSLHESVEHIQVKDKKDDHKVLEIVQKGYRIDDEIIRGAKVRVGEFKK